MYVDRFISRIWTGRPVWRFGFAFCPWTKIFSKDLSLAKPKWSETTTCGWFPEVGKATFGLQQESGWCRDCYFKKVPLKLFKSVVKFCKWMHVILWRTHAFWWEFSKLKYKKTAFKYWFTVYWLLILGSNEAKNQTLFKTVLHFSALGIVIPFLDLNCMKEG